jgi:hypothetical protein
MPHPASRSDAFGQTTMFPRDGPKTNAPPDLGGPKDPVMVPFPFPGDNSGSGSSSTRTK